MATDRHHDMLWQDVEKAKDRLRKEREAEEARIRAEKLAKLEHAALEKLAAKLTTSGVALSEAAFMPETSKASLKTFLEAMKTSSGRPEKQTIEREVKRGLIRRALGSSAKTGAKSKMVLGWELQFARGTYHGWTGKGTVVATLNGQLYMNDNSAAQINQWDAALFRNAIVQRLAEMDVAPPTRIEI